MMLGSAVWGAGEERHLSNTFSSWLLSAVMIITISVLW